MLFSLVAVLAYIPTKSARGFPFLHVLSSIYCCRIFGDGHFDQCEVIPHVKLILTCHIYIESLRKFEVVIVLEVQF